MAIGSYMGRVFTVSSMRILTPSNLKGSTGSDWAKHETVGRKARSQYLGPKLKSYSFDLLLRAQDGVHPLNTMRHFQRMAEAGMADYFIIGTRPLTPYPLKITSITDEWNAVLRGGFMVECMVSMTVEEYV